MGLFEQQKGCPLSILRAYRDGEYTDLKITCEPLTFEVHRVVVCPPCDFFKRSMRFGKEAEEQCVDLPEDDPEMIRRLMAYLYLGDYDPCNGNSLSPFENIKQHKATTPVAPAHHSRYRGIGFASVDLCACLAPNTENVKQPVMNPTPQDRPADYAVIEKPVHGLQVVNPLTIHATMYALADKYQVDGLGKLAQEKFESCLHHHANSEDFVTAVQIAYGSTPDSNRGLKDTIIKAFSTHFKVHILEIPGAEAKLETIDSLSLLLIKSWPHKTEPPKQNASKPPVSSPFATTSPVARSSTARSTPVAPRPGIFRQTSNTTPASLFPSAPPVTSSSIFRSVPSDGSAVLFGGWPNSG